ncbi:uroporphyrinogen-III synthase [uncultured Helicobacter sp.]|uniref:uroporphyrinogen-III synthase n=1 Tax=uncultured Helicobacter sp. TaxID=175537 RepID=UPI00374E3C02
MREIVLVGTRPSKEVKSLIVSKIVFEEIPHNVLEGRDSLIFTSRYAIAALAQCAQNTQELAHWRELPSYVIGGSSAKELQKYGGNIAFIGSDAHGANFANDLVKLLADKAPLYMRAQHIVSRLTERLSEAHIDIKECIAYVNEPLKLEASLKPKSNSILIFAAPSAFKMFKQNFGWDPHYVAVAIGMTTFSAFDPDIVAFVSPTQSIDGCIELAKDLAQKMP